MPYRDPTERRAYQRAWVAARRLAFFADKACVDCGAVDDLELDHRNPGEKVSHSIWSWSQERRDAEIAKCEVRCASCHRDRHAVLWQQHGTRKRYEKGCRCGLCVEVGRARSARLYAARKKAA